MLLECTEGEVQSLDLDSQVSPAQCMAISGLGSHVYMWVGLGSQVWVGLSNLEFEPDSLRTGSLSCTQVGMAEAYTDTLVEMKML